MSLVSGNIRNTKSRWSEDDIVNLKDIVAPFRPNKWNWIDDLMSDWRFDIPYVCIITYTLWGTSYSKYVFGENIGYLVITTVVLWLLPAGVLATIAIYRKELPPVWKSMSAKEFCETRKLPSTEQLLASPELEDVISRDGLNEPHFLRYSFEYLDTPRVGYVIVRYAGLQKLPNGSFQVCGGIVGVFSEIDAKFVPPVLPR